MHGPLRSLLPWLLALRSLRGGCADVCDRDATCTGIGATPRLWFSAASVPEKRLKQLETLITTVEAYGPPGYARVRRNFGEGNYEGGHLVTYLHLELAKPHRGALQRWLWSLATRADSEAGWNVTSAALPPRFDGDPQGPDAKESVEDDLRIRMRCAEAIEYLGADAPWLSGRRGEASLGAPSDLSWHDDGQTLVTLALPLSSPGADFDGGGVEVRRRPFGEGETLATQLVENARRGDALAWRGWDEHRIRAVTRGKRQVIIVEWWEGPPPSAENPRPDDFVEGIHRAIAVDPSAPTLLLTLALAQKEGGARMEAEASFHAAVELDPLFIRGRHELGVFLAETGAETEAETWFNSALSQNPASPATLFGLARLRQVQGDHPGAERRLRQALSLSPRNANLHTELGLLLDGGSDGDEAGALASYQNALELDPTQQRALYFLGLLEARRGNETVAEPLLLAAAASNPAEGAPRYDLGVLNERRGKAQAAEDHYKAAAALNPQDFRAWNNLALLQERRGDFVSARDSYNEVLRMLPRDAGALVGLGVLDAEIGRRGAAERRFRDALEADPHSPDAHLRLGILLQEQHAEEEAEASLAEAVRLRPQDDEAHFNLGLLFRGRPSTLEAARSHFRAAWDLNPRDDEYWEKLNLLPDKL